VEVLGPTAPFLSWTIGGGTAVVARMLARGFLSVNTAMSRGFWQTQGASLC